MPGYSETSIASSVPPASSSSANQEPKVAPRPRVASRTTRVRDPKVGSFLIQYSHILIFSLGIVVKGCTKDSECPQGKENGKKTAGEVAPQGC